jgi:hypothetical protein
MPTDLEYLIEQGYRIVDLDFQIYDTLNWIFQKEKEVIIYNPELKKIILYKKD